MNYHLYYKDPSIFTALQLRERGLAVTNPSVRLISLY